MNNKRFSVTETVTCKELTILGEYGIIRNNGGSITSGQLDGACLTSGNLPSFRCAHLPGRVPWPAARHSPLTPSRMTAEISREY